MKDNMDKNFNLLVERVIDSLDKSDLEKINYYLKNIKTPTLCSGVGGSSVVSNFMSKVLNKKNNIITSNIEPRDMNYLNLNNYDNIICSSYSGKNYGVDISFNNELNKYLFSTNSIDGVNNIVYSSENKEHSFISLAATLIPMTILLNYYLDNDKRIINNILEDTNIPNIEKNNIFEIMSGYETSTAHTYLESTLVESGVAIPIVHDKYSYCHGRSTIGKDGNNSLVYFNGNTELDNVMLNELDKYYKEIINLNYKYNDKVVNDFYLTYKSFLLTHLLAQKTNKDLSIVDYSPVVKKIYKYNGNM